MNEKVKKNPKIPPVDVNDGGFKVWTEPHFKLVVLSATKVNLRHEIFLFSLQFSATSINLAQYGQTSYENQAHRVNLPKMGKCVTTIAGQSDWSQHCHWLSCLTYGQSRRRRGIMWAEATQKCTRPPHIEIWNNKLAEFCQFVQCQGINRETKNSLL